MSYCVNCGVELEMGAKHCPLCAVPVINPLEGQNQSQDRAYPEKVVLPPKIRRRYSAILISLIMLIPNIVCPIVNYFFYFEKLGMWSIYVFIPSAIVWFFFILPFLWRRAEVFLTILIDTVVTCLCLFIISLQTTPSDWFLKVAFPFVLMFAVELSILILWAKVRKRDWPILSIAVLVFIIVCSFELELLITHYISLSFSVIISFIIGLSCLSLIIFFAVVSKNKRLRAWLSRKFFI